MDFEWTDRSHVLTGSQEFTRQRKLRPRKHNQGKQQQPFDIGQCQKWNTKQTEREHPNAQTQQSKPGYVKTETANEDNSFADN